MSIKVVFLASLAVVLVCGNPLGDSEVGPSKDKLRARRHNTYHPACGDKAVLTTCMQTKCYPRDCDCACATGNEYPYWEQDMINCNNGGVARRCCKECQTMVGQRPTNNHQPANPGSIIQVIRPPTSG